MKIKLTKEQQELLNGGNVVWTAEGNRYFNLPFWYKKEGDDLFTAFLLDKLPKDLRLHLEDDTFSGVIAKKDIESFGFRKRLEIDKHWSSECGDFELCYLDKLCQWIILDFTGEEAEQIFRGAISSKDELCKILIQTGVIKQKS